jgi:hypothetical protein
MARPHGFTYREYGDGTVEVRHFGRSATVLRGERAARFLQEVTTQDAQAVMARWTGNYRRGNERVARRHPRHDGR